eukprot:g35426.t1
MANLSNLHIPGYYGQFSVANAPTQHIFWTVVAREFGIASVNGDPSSAQKNSPASSTAHILSLLLRLRQCCCHLSLLKTALNQSEMESEGITLSLEEQLNALSLSEVTAFDNKPAVSLNGTSFKANLFEKTRKSTK